MLSPSRPLWLVAPLAVIVAIVACDPAIREGESCNGARPYSQPDPCESGLACLAGPTGALVCTAAKACHFDSDCPDHFGCSAIDGWDGHTRYCSTRCQRDGCAAGYGCAADGTSCELRLGMSCYVTDVGGAGCGTGAACSAVTRVCTLLPRCNDDSECGGFACTDHACALSCTPATTTGDYPDHDVGCAPGFACNPQTFACSSTLGRACDPASDDTQQCGVGSACSPASHTCVSATPCESDAECSGYGCANGYCLLACTKNVLPCAIGRTCNLDAHTCS